MSNDNPFSGLHLSEQTSSGKIEQRLFSSETPPSPPPQRPASLPETEPPTPIPQIKPPTTEPEKTRQAAQDRVRATSSPTKKPAATPLPRFNLNDEPLYKASYLFTLEELEALEDLKLELRREYDQKVTKNELVRSALHMLLEDHKENEKRSYATRKIRKG